MISSCSFGKDVYRALELCACAVLVFAIGCGGGSVAPAASPATPAPATNSTSPGTTSVGTGPTGGGNSAPAPAPAGFLYVGLDDSFSVYANIPHIGNPSIAGFAIASDGTLQATPGSPYAGPAAALAANPATAALYAASGSKINVDRINGDGSLTTTATLNSQSLSPTLGIYWDLSLNTTAQTLYATAAHGAGTSFFEIYKAGGDGALASNGSQEVDVASAHPYFTPNGSRAYQPFCYHLDGEIFGYTAGADGKLNRFDTKALIPSLGVPEPACPYALSISSDGTRIAAQLNAKSGGGAALGVYTINSDGTLTAQSGSPFATTAQGSDIAWDASGRYIAVAAKDGLWVYSFASSAAVPVSGSPIVTGPIDHLAFNKAGTLLFATSAGTQNVYVFNFNGSTGAATPAAGSPHKVNLAPYELVLSER